MALSHEDLAQRLASALAASRAAAALLRAEFHRHGGPRGAGSHADVDEEAEAAILDILGRRHPGEAYLGEEFQDRVLGNAARAVRPGLVWIVDPNDGTSPFLKGFRGSAVSIALVEDGLPVLGVVQAWDGPGPDGDLFHWHRGAPVTRNGRPVARGWPPAPDAAGLALVSHEADRKNAAAHALAVAPLRHLALPSIAWRMALVAAGEGDVAVSLGGPEAWDLAAGHALLLGAGGVLLDRHGRELRYDARGRCHAGGGVFGGAPALAADFARRDWSPTERRVPPPEGLGLVFPAAHAPRPEAGALDRARGCLLGQAVGDALGAQVEFKGAARIAAAHPQGLRAMADGGAWDTLAGQPTDDTELALHLARVLVRDGAFDAAAVREAYGAWRDSRPFDMGRTTALGLAGTPDPRSQANGALMRVSPLGIFGAWRREEEVAAWAEADAALTHPHPVCRQASALFARSLAVAIRHGLDPRGLHARALRWAQAPGIEPALGRALAAAAAQPPGDFESETGGWVLVAWQNAFWQLLHAANPEEALVDTVGRGGDTDTNAAIAGALLGAVHGAAAIPARWRLAVLSCRPLEGLPGVRRPRPHACWPVDIPVLAERLLAAGMAGER